MESQVAEEKVAVNFLAAGKNRYKCAVAIHMRVEMALRAARVVQNQTFGS